MGHGLSAAPELILIKDTESTGSWLVYHVSLGGDFALYLQTIDDKTDNATFFNDTDSTSSVFSVGTHSDGNTSGNEIIAYCWHSVDGFSKFGSYEGNASANGPIVETGFEVGW